MNIDGQMWKELLQRVDALEGKMRQVYRPKLKKDRGDPPPFYVHPDGPFGER